MLLSQCIDKLHNAKRTAQDIKSGYLYIEKVKAQKYSYEKAKTCTKSFFYH